MYMLYTCYIQDVQTTGNTNPLEHIWNQITQEYCIKRQKSGLELMYYMKYINIINAWMSRTPGSFSRAVCQRGSSLAHNPPLRSFSPCDVTTTAWSPAPSSSAPSPRWGWVSPVTARFPLKNTPRWGMGSQKDTRKATLTIPRVMALM